MGLYINREIITWARERNGFSVEDLAQAMKVAIEIEALCEIYLKALAVAEPTTLDGAQMAEVIEKFRSYGKTARR